MIEGLRTASRLLEEALDGYLDACTVFSKHYDSHNAHNRLSHSLSDGIANELQLISSYKVKVHRAEAIVSHIRNDTPALSPISALPSETLAYIFQLVLHTHPCLIVTSRSSTKSLHYPDTLSHVCSRWRHVALSAQNLWSHIDVPLTPSRLLDRSKLFATRSGHSPLYIHVSDELKSIRDYSEADMINFCAIVAPWMWSLDLLIAYGLEEHSQSVLRSCFANCVPGALTNLTLRNSGGRARFFEAVGNPANRESQVLGLPQLEDALLRVTTLDLSSVYLYWASKVYHGLVELHLHGADTGGTISESQLVHILASSPQLRIFVFDLTITDHLPDDTLPKPISLESLEVLDLSLMYYNHCETLLRWIAPGLNPVRVSLGSFAGSCERLFGEVFSQFQARSNLSQLGLTGTRCPLSLRRLLAFLPKLRVLRLCGLFIDESHEESLDLDRRLPNRLSQLDALHLRDCHIPVDELRWIVEMHLIHTITVHEGWVLLCSERGFVKKYGTKDVLEKYLSGIAPIFKALTHEEALQI